MNDKDRMERSIFDPSKEELITGHERALLLQNKTRLAILMYLRMNSKLAFGKLVDLLGKSRSTVHHHLQKLIEGNIVREVEEQTERGQFDPKFYELVPNPVFPIDFKNITEVPIEDQQEVFLTYTKIHQNNLFYLYQLVDLFKAYLDGIENDINSMAIKSTDILDIWNGNRNPSLKKPTEIKFNEFFYFGTQVNEEVYKEYKKEMHIFHDKLIKLREKNEKLTGDKSRPYFLFHVSAPLGKPFLVKDYPKQNNGNEE